MDGAEHFQGLLGVGYRVANKGGLVRAQGVVLVPGSGIPGGGHHGLIVLNLGVLDHHPVRQGPPGRLVEPKAPDFARREGGLVEGFDVTLGEVVHQGLPLLVRVSWGKRATFSVAKCITLY
jgi:hypothetical protein